MPSQSDQKLREAFGARVKELRKHKKLTQKELAQRLDVHHGQLNKYEMGLSVPPLEKLVALTQALSTSLDFLVFGAAGDADLHDTRLQVRLVAMQDLPHEDQEAIIVLLDAMITKHRARWAAAPVDAVVGK